MLKIHVSFLIIASFLFLTFFEQYCSEAILSSTMAEIEQEIKRDTNSGRNYKAFIKSLNYPEIVSKGEGFTSYFPSQKCLVLKVSSDDQDKNNEEVD